MAEFGSAARAFDARVRGAAERARLVADAEALLARSDAAGLRLLAATEPCYPAPLRRLADPPPVLWALGALERLDRPAVAIVGTRDATAYGERIARLLAGALAHAGAAVVSGMARGIDAAAHRAALDAGGATVAVLGTGADVAYPRAHRPLHREIAGRGLVLSELPPGEKAGPASFPRRNRIIAGLARLTIVVEAGARSGALITAREALDLGDDVAVVPGPIDAPQSAGSNALLRDGAHPILEVADALQLAGLAAAPAPAVRPLDPAERRVWEALSRGPLDVDTLAIVTALPAADCLGAVTSLELDGLLVAELDGRLRRQ